MVLERPPKVFISYSHETQTHGDAVFNLSERLRKDGIDCALDQYEDSPPEGWPQWMEKQIRECDFVLVICSDFYLKKLLGKVKPSESLGVRWEGNLIYSHLYNAGSSNTKFIPVLLANGKPDHIPMPLQGATYYKGEDPQDFEKLYWRLRGISLKDKAPLGKLKPLPPKKRTTNPGLFVTGFIDLVLWNEAKWLGVLYVCSPTQPPWLGLLFQNKEPARKIFEQWQERLGRNDAYEEMRVSIVEGNIPGEHPGYTVYINANVENILRRADDLRLDVPNQHIMVVGRMHRMNPEPGSKNLQMFKAAFQQFQCYQLCPAIREPEGIRQLTGYGVLKKEINFRHVKDIKSRNDIDSAVLKKFHTKQTKGKK